jgi:hypothetical protein
LHRDCNDGGDGASIDGLNENLAPAPIVLFKLNFITLLGAAYDLAKS